MEKKRIILMGTSTFSIPSFEKLINNANFEIVGVFTQPDKKVGRKQILTETPVKKYITENYPEIEIFTPASLKVGETRTQVGNLRPDLIYVVSYGKIIPESILSLPKFGCVNLHASLLPLLRGASPLASTILNGFTKTGITFFKLDYGVDSGEIIWQEEIPLSGEETAGILHDYLAEFGAKVVSNVLLQYLKGELVPYPQDDKKATFCTKLDREDGKIDWAIEDSEKINRKILAFHPWPGVFTTLNGKRMKILKAVMSEERPHKLPGTVFLTSDGSVAVRAKNKSIILKEIQLEGKKPCLLHDFLMGRKDFIGSVLK